MPLLGNVLIGDDTYAVKLVRTLHIESMLQFTHTQEHISYTSFTYV